MSDQLNEAARLYVDRYLFQQRELLHKDKALRDAAPDLLEATKGAADGIYSPRGGI